ncbi:hypothetical protein ACHAXS_004915 [Conticribra weissflogii]
MVVDTVIIGGGVVGLSILRTALLSGYNAILLERNPHLCDDASGRNSGIICTGVDAAPGSLERALIRDSISRIREFCEDHNVPKRECGSLVCLWPWDEEEDEASGGNQEEEKLENESEFADYGGKVNKKLRCILRDSHIAGDKDAAYWDSKEVATLEPSLSTNCQGAIHIPGEIVIDPWLFPLAMATHAREIGKVSGLGDVIQSGREVVMEKSGFDKNSGLWAVATRSTGGDENNLTVISSKSVINAAGIDSDAMQLKATSALRATDGCSSLLPSPTFEAQPRRGQYIVYSAPKLDKCDEAKTNSLVDIPKTVPIRPIQPIPTERTKGIFVYSTLYNQIVVGPTAKDQSSRTNNTVDPEVAKQLAAHASRVFNRTMGSSQSASCFDFDCNIVGEYVGIRPGTTKRDYQIHVHYPAKFITVGGIRSTGLTASLGIGRHVVQTLLASLVPKPEHVTTAAHPVNPTPLPNVVELVKDYHARADGTIAIHGHTYKVTHPLTKMGWDAKTGLASIT